MIRLICRIYRPHPTSWKPPCYGKQVGEVAPAPRLDVRIDMVAGERESKNMDRPLSKFATLTTGSG